MQTAEKQHDIFFVRPIFAFAAIALCAGTAFSFSQLFVGLSQLLLLVYALFGIPALLVWLILTLVRCVKAASQRMWRTAISRLLTFVVALPLLVFAFFVGPYVHFGLSYPYYAFKVRQLPNDGSQPIDFYWGGTGMVGSSQTDRTLIYDPTGKTNPGVSTSEDDPNSTYIIERLIGNFYLLERIQG